MTDENKFEVGPWFHKHDPEDSWREGASCSECPSAEGPALTVTRVDHKTRTITVRGEK